MHHVCWCKSRRQPVRCTTDTGVFHGFPYPQLPWLPHGYWCTAPACRQTHTTYAGVPSIGPSLTCTTNTGARIIAPIQTCITYTDVKNTSAGPRYLTYTDVRPAPFRYPSIPVTSRTLVYFVKHASSLAGILHHEYWCKNGIRRSSVHHGYWCKISMSPLSPMPNASCTLMYLTDGYPDQEATVGHGCRCIMMPVPEYSL